MHQFLQEGAKVIAPVRTEKGRQALLKDLEKLHYKIDIAKNLVILVVGNYDSPEKMEKLATEISYVHPEINHIVSCFGGDFEKALHRNYILMMSMTLSTEPYHTYFLHKRSFLY